MKPYTMDKQIQSDHSTSSNVFLTGIILLANLDFNGFVDYGIRTVIGGLIWFGFQALNDYRTRKKQNKQ
jgi:hypothetical protein